MVNPLPPLNIQIDSRCLCCIPHPIRPEDTVKLDADMSIRRLSTPIFRRSAYERTIRESHERLEQYIAMVATESNLPINYFRVFVQHTSGVDFSRMANRNEALSFDDMIKISHAISKGIEDLKQRRNQSAPESSESS